MSKKTETADVVDMATKTEASKLTALEMTQLENLQLKSSLLEAQREALERARSEWANAVRKRVGIEEGVNLSIGADGTVKKEDPNV